jgi:hypothetical protein
MSLALFVKDQIKNTETLCVSVASEVTLLGHHNLCIQASNTLNFEALQALDLADS